MPFLKYRWLYGTGSGLLMIISILALTFWGLKPAIDFTGGTLIEYQLSQPPDLGKIRQALNDQTNFSFASLQTVEGRRLVIKTAPMSQQQSQTITQILSTLDPQVSQDSFETIGPTFGQELLIKMLIAVLLTAGFILLYVAWTFRNLPYGVSAILAMFHDSLVLLGGFALLGHFFGVEVDTLFVTGVLTTLSFSVHDTVVVYDRIRETNRHHPQLAFKDIANQAITQTMSRSLNNSLTIIFMLTALLLLGGSHLRWFVTALLIGTVTGTYSSPFVAVPLLVTWQEWRKKR